MNRAIHALLAVVVSALVLASPVQAESSSVRDIVIKGGPQSRLDATPVQLDARLYVPQSTPAPSIILAHGFGGSKDSVSSQAQQLQSAGYVVLTYSARGFGKTNAAISMNSPEFEVVDAEKIVNYLSRQNFVIQDASNDPRVGVAGGSYGGALALLLAGQDDRIDAVVSDITWNSLRTSLFSQNDGTAELGAFKQMWTSNFFSVGMATPPSMVNPCGRFSLEWCLAYQEASTTGNLSPQSQALMTASSPSSVTANISAPALLMAGQADSLFPLSEVDATYQQISKSHPDTPLKMVWHAGGHDGGIDETDRLNGLSLNWFDKYLAKKNVDVGPAFSASFASKSIVGNNSRNKVSYFESDNYPGLLGESRQQIKLLGEAQTVVAPAGGSPAQITVLPGFGGTIANLINRSLPNQAAVFESETFNALTPMIGAGEVKLKVTSLNAVEDLVLFASLRIVNGESVPRFPNGLVSSIRLHNMQAGETRTITVTLPAIVAEISAGEQLRLVVSTTDSAYRNSPTPATYEISLVDGEVSLPVSALTKVSQETSPAMWFGITSIFIAIVSIILWWRRPNHKEPVFKPEYQDVPLQVENLVKQFKGGQRAVDGISWSVPPGVVLGLLGPNGAGKTTTMRMAMGLIQPTDGAVYVYGHEVRPGAPVLARIGSLVEGSGFLPHLTGRENLDIFWQASGRMDQDPQLEAVLAIADLGTAIDRKVRTYSQGMRQRLGIAQAMLGMPDLLMLDEPTNGLDPPQIRAMREMIKEYAKTGRTVIVSSHMLSEVEQTCSHVIVMHRGRLVTSGRVDELLAGRTNMHLEEFFLEVVGDDLTIGKS